MNEDKKSCRFPTKFSLGWRNEILQSSSEWRVHVLCIAFRRRVMFWWLRIKEWRFLMRLCWRCQHEHQLVVSLCQVSFSKRAFTLLKKWGSSVSGWQGFSSEKRREEAVETRRIETGKRKLRVKGCMKTNAISCEWKNWFQSVTHSGNGTSG